MRADEILELVKGPTVLDIGCAGHEVRPNQPGWLHGRLRERFQVTGIDVSEANIRIMRSLGIEDVHVQNADTFELGRKYDTVVAGEVIEHLSNPGQFLSRVRKHLVSEGRLVLSTPYGFSLMYSAYAVNYFPKTCENAEHTCWFCPTTIGELARREGFEIEEWRLIDDYDPSVTSLKYRLYWKLIHAFGKLMPDKITKTTMLMVFKCLS